MGMLPFLIAGLAAGAVLLVAVGVAMSGGSGGVASRLERYARSGGDGPSGMAGTGDRESAVIAGLSRVMEGQGFTARLSTEIARADLKLRPAEFVAAWIASPFVFLAAAFVLGFIFKGFQNVIALAVAFLVGAVFPRYYLKYRQGKRLKAFATQLPDTITLLANSLRAGSSFLQGIELVTREGRPPISEEFERVVREMSLGVALQPALNNLVRRVASEDLELRAHPDHRRDQHPDRHAALLRLRHHAPAGGAGRHPVPHQPELHGCVAQEPAGDVWPADRDHLHHHRPDQHGHRLRADPPYRRHQGVATCHRK